MTLDAVNIYRTDGSSAARIGPYIVYAQEFDLLNLNTWLGYGCDYGGLHAYSVMVGHEVEKNLGVGGMINFLYDYGLISFIPFLILIIQNTGVRSFGFFLFIFIYSTVAFNMYTLWIFVILTYSIWYFKRQNIIINYNSVTTR
jgi:hypothetical protein